MSTEFVYWGDHEISARLTHDVHRGRRFFWFKEEYFHDGWFEKQLEQALAVAGPRYTPELNVELPIANVFDGLGRTDEFWGRLGEVATDLQRALAGAESGKSPDLLGDEFADLRRTVREVLAELDVFQSSEVFLGPRESIVDRASVASAVAWKCVRSLQDRISEQSQSSPKTSEYRTQENAAYDLRKLARALNEVESAFESSDSIAANVRALLVVGEGGTGKTHLLCDVARNRVASHLPTILLHGRWFTSGEPWKQITENLGLSCGRDEFLGALTSAAQAKSRRALILVDAANEARDTGIWDSYLAGMLALLEAYPWIAIAISVRTSYEGLIPEGLVPIRLVRIVHHGFLEREYEAAKTFFDHFDLEAPSIPLITPEFQNPLFLKIFCQTLRNQGLTKVPTGLSGFTAIFRAFLESVNRKLSRPEHLNFDPKSRVVLRAVDALVQLMVKNRKNWVKRDEAVSAVDSLLPSTGYTGSLYRHLIAEGVIIEDRAIEGGVGSEEYARFSYERFSDHLIVSSILDHHLDNQSPEALFVVGGILHEVVKSEALCFFNQGLIDALSVQLPEVSGRELATLLPAGAAWRPMRLAFVRSVIWRSTSAFSDETLQYLNGHVVRYRESHDAFLEALLTVASNPEHPYNAEFLHRHLVKFSLAERDEWWTTYLHYSVGTHNPVDRLVEWGWSERDKSHISEEAIRLFGTVLAWFLASSHRSLRDRTTKALVSLMKAHLDLVSEFISAFKEVNDPYILERLYGVAYGCALRQPKGSGLLQLATVVYDLVFKDGTPPAHILLRDYARGVVEVALSAGLPLTIDPTKIRPPYKSEWPDDLPAKDAFASYDSWSEGMPDEEWARVHLFQSVMGSGDFARYVLGTDHPSFFQWSSLHLGEEHPPTLRDRAAVWEESLTEKQRRAWRHYKDVESEHRAAVILRGIRGEDSEPSAPSLEAIEQRLSQAESRLRKSLGSRKARDLDEVVLPSSDLLPGDEIAFDISKLQSFIFQRVLDLGWTVERFGAFDRGLSYGLYGRDPNKPERIGKKYQWIAYHEALARIADNFEFKDSRYSDKLGVYRGPWQIDLRDIDPSLLLTRPRPGDSKVHTVPWWTPEVYGDWREENHKVWLERTDDLPSPLDLIELIAPGDGSQWLTLSASYNWEEPPAPRTRRYERPTRVLWYILNSYLLATDDLDDFVEWAKSQDFMGRWMPESHESHQIFLREFHWSDAFEYFSQTYGANEWTRSGRFELPKEVYIPVNEYAWTGGGYDGSLSESIHIRLPAKLLVDSMRLSWKGPEACFADELGRVTVCDPSVEAAGPGALLCRKDALSQFLSANRLGIVWTLLGEKNVVAEDFGSRTYSWPTINGAYTLKSDKVLGALKSTGIRFPPGKS